MTARLTFALGAIATAAFVVGGGAASAHRMACPDQNPPNELVLSAGTDQTARLGTPFGQQLKAQLANTNGCTLTGNLAGVGVEFDAPDSGPSGIFASSGGHSAAVATDAQGLATSPVFTANDNAGSYAVSARSDDGSVTFSLTNTAVGVAFSVSLVSGSGQSTTVFAAYPEPLQASVADSSGSPIQGVTVQFSLVAGPSGAGASFVGGTEASAVSNASGVATSPPLIANGNPGRFTAVASVASVGRMSGSSWKFGGGPCLTIRR